MDEKLLNCIKNERIPHAILISGPSGSGKTVLARRAAAWFCLGADTPELLSGCPNYAELSGMNVGVKQVREWTASTGMQGFNGGRRAYCITDAHRMSAQSQNALLKTLEEPPYNTLMLLTGSEVGLLPTVRSRCMIERVGARPLQQIQDGLMAEGVDEATAALCAQLSDGIFGRARQLADPEGMALRRQALDLLDMALSGDSPFAQTTALIERTGGGDGSDGKKSKSDPERARILLELWEGMLRDALMLWIHGSSTQNIDRQQLAEKIAERFTGKQIQSIIKMFEIAQQRLQAGANPQFTLDVVLAKLPPMANKNQ
ncbi:MAG: hypothetical protein RRZ24_00480 [Clostridia bacterium]